MAENVLRPAPVEGLSGLKLVGMAFNTNFSTKKYSFHKITILFTQNDRISFPSAENVLEPTPVEALSGLKIVGMASNTTFLCTKLLIFHEITLKITIIRRQNHN